MCRGGELASRLLNYCMNILRRWTWRRVTLVVAGFMMVGDIAGATEPSLYGVCAAYPPELEALRKEFGVSRENGFTETEINGLSFWRGRYSGREIVVFRTGVSLVNAAYQLQLALDRFPITHVLFAGVAGGVDPALHVGDVVVPERWAYHSEAVYLNPDGKEAYIKPDYFRSPYQNFGMIFPNDVNAVRGGEKEFSTVAAFPVDPELLAAGRRAATKLAAMRKGGREVSVGVGGTGVAGTVFLDNAAYREWIFKIWQARCVDMESTALAHVAYANRKPIVIVRGLSDLAGGQQGKNPIEANEAQVSEIAARVLRAIVDEL